MPLAIALLSTTLNRMEKTLPDILHAIGNTPLLELERFVRQRGLKGRIVIKLEYFNPGFSKKDRVGLHMVEEAEARGLLRPGQTVVELTSGNTGTGLALACLIKGYRFVAVMSEGNSLERARMMEALGAEVVRVPQDAGSRPGEVSGKDLELVENATRRIAEERSAFRTDQFSMEGNVEGERLLGRELWEQSGESVTVFADTLGSGGSFSGVAGFLKERAPGLRAYAVEPTNAVYFGETSASVTGTHKIQGCGYSRPLPLFKPELVEGYLTIGDDEARDTARQLAATEGVFGGYSTGANVAAAAKLLEGPETGETVAVIACDSGLKYLSTDLYS